ncbi:MAG: alkene reductase [Proteobacteria bacterium]|nr:alkene reductase [Burkholderiales bacterium]
MTPTLFSPLTAGSLELRNRIVMAPMTRSRADDAGHVQPLSATYYAQRASAGLIITEGVFPSAIGKGYVRTPGLADAAQAASWKQVTDAVHAAGGRIVVQLMHAGRISHPTLLPAGATPVAPSAIQPKGAVYTDGGMLPHPVPRALALDEIASTIAEYGAAAKRAIDAGFDGVELHSASGYLPMQFLSSGSNTRTDGYGGSVGNRVRFVIEALQSIVDAIGAERTGIKISPENPFNDITDANPKETYTTLVEAIRPLGLAYLHSAPAANAEMYHVELKKRFGGVYLAGVGFDRAHALDIVARGGADAVVFGTMFVSNPDLPARLEVDAPLTPADPATFYTPGEKGYTDYPTLETSTA